LAPLLRPPRAQRGSAALDRSPPSAARRLVGPEGSRQARHPAGRGPVEPPGASSGWQGPWNHPGQGLVL